jgi:hypothetical protein
MRTDRPVFLKFRNDEGEVQVCLTAVEGVSTALAAGFSCCNPKDMHLPRKERVPKHCAVSLGRMEKKPVTIPLPENLDEVPEDKRYDVIRAAVIDFMADVEAHNLGLKPYRGDPERCEFHQWFNRFYMELRC